MGDFAILFETLAVVLTGSCFAALVGFIVRDAVVDRKQAARAASARKGPSPVRKNAAKAARAEPGWVVSSAA